ncbi:NlpC/P60 family protein [Clostridiales bacterium KLE1615]|nr:NlpC/P60 family protein [Clostridiales bacterium KLE1615]
MKIKGNRFVTSILAASMLSGTFFVPASAGELEGESAIAGMAVTLNNYYAGEETPDEAILDYLVPKAQATSEAESETETEEPKTVMAATVAVTSDASNVGLVSAAGYLNVREQPSTGSVTVGRLFSNCQVNIKSSVNNSEGSWYRITCGDVEGYVSAAYVLVGTAAKTAEDNIQNRYAVVTADQLNVRDSASDSAKVVGTVYKDEEYAIIEDQGDFVKIHISNDEVGYVSKSGITIKTQFAQAQKVDNEFVSQELENFMIDINYSRNVYEQAMAEGTGEGYYRAYAAIVYAAELLGYYSEFAADSGLEDLAATSKQEQESALALADAAYKLASDSGYFTQVAESVASSEAAAESSAAESVQETQAQPSTDASSEGNTTNGTGESAAPSSSASDETISVEVPTVASVTGIEACYQGGTKYVGDVVYTAELFVRVSYSDGTVKDIYDGWYSPQVGMTLKQEGYNVVTMYYGDFSSNLEVYANPAPETQPAAPETQPAAPAPAPETQPAAPETQPAAPAPAPAPSGNGQSIVDYAMQWVGQCNYVWGGTNLTPGGGVDCSGFTMNVYAAFGISLPHYSGEQINYGQAVSYEQLQPGDLICFSGHVAIYIGGGMMVHAASAERGIVVDNVFYNKQPIGYRRLV